MSLQNHLISERERVLKELADIEALLVSRCGWTHPKHQKPTAEKPADAPTQENSRPSGPVTPRQSVAKFGTEEETSIPYMEEAVDFVTQWSGTIFGLKHFREFLAAKYGAERINEQSMRGPMPKLVKRGLIIVVRPGLGKLPVIYKKGPTAIAEDDDSNLL